MKSNPGAVLTLYLYRRDYDDQQHGITREKGLLSMPMRDIRTNIVLEGEQQYKSQLNDAMNAVKLLGLQVKENTTVYKLNSDSANGNRERMALLSKRNGTTAKNH